MPPRWLGRAALVVERRRVTIVGLGILVVNDENGREVALSTPRPGCKPALVCRSCAEPTGSFGAFNIDVMPDVEYGWEGNLRCAAGRLFLRLKALSFTRWADSSGAR